MDYISENEIRSIVQKVLAGASAQTISSDCFQYSFTLPFRKTRIVPPQAQKRSPLAATMAVLN